MAEFKYEINDAVATLSQSGDYTCEVDIRKWNRAEDKMQKGITLDKEEALALFEALQDFDFEKLG